MNRFFLLLAGAALLCATSASAGPLLSANLSASIAGAILDLDATGATGSLDGAGNFTLDAGSGFAGNVTINTSVTAAGGAATIMFLDLNFGPNDAIAGNTGDLGSIGVVGNGIPATGIATGTALGAAGITLAQVNIDYGAGGTGAQPPFQLTVGGFLTLATLTLSAPEGDLWHIGQVKATGLYTGDVGASTPLPDVTATGGVSVTGGGNTVVTLVTLGKTLTRTNSVNGLSESVSASPVFLTLTYETTAAPEPGTILLLAGGLLGLAGIGRRKA